MSVYARTVGEMLKARSDANLPKNPRGFLITGYLFARESSVERIGFGKMCEKAFNSQVRQPLQRVGELGDFFHADAQSPHAGVHLEMNRRRASSIERCRIQRLGGVAKKDCRRQFVRDNLRCLSG